MTRCSLPFDEAAVRALVQRIAANSGLDGYTARAMVEDVRERGAASPHADVVGEAARVILQPVLDAFAEFARQLGELYAQIGRVLAPVLREWVTVFDALQLGGGVRSQFRDKLGRFARVCPRCEGHGIVDSCQAPCTVCGGYGYLEPPMREPPVLPSPAVPLVAGRTPRASPVAEAMSTPDLTGGSSTA